jgi:hypothetical protein
MQHFSMVTFMRRFLMVAAAVGLAMVLQPGAAQAWSHGSRTSVFLGFNGWYPPPPVIYAPPPAAYPAPPVAQSVPAPVEPAPQPLAGQPNCREYTTNVEVAGQPQQGYGVACQQPDGTWRIVSSR